MRFSDIQRHSIFLLKTLGVAVLYALLIHMDHHYFESDTAVSSFETASGFALAVLLIGGRQYVWGVFLGAVLMHTMTVTFWESAAISTGDALEAFCGAWLLTRDSKFDLAIRSLRDYLRLILLGGVVSIAIGASAGVALLYVFGFVTPENLIGELAHWWMGDMLGVILVAPLMLVCRYTKNDWVGTKRVVDAVLLLGLAFVAGQIVFLGWFHDTIGLFELIAKGYWMFLFVALIAFRLETRGTVIAVNMIAFQALLGAYQETGFFAHDIAQTHLVSYWCYTVILSLVGMALATYFTERKLTDEALRTSLASLQAILNNSPYLAWLKDAEGRYVHINKTYVDYAHLKDGQQVIGKTDFDLWPKKLAEKYRCDDAEIMASRQQRHVEESSFDGNRTHWVETFKTPVIDEKGNVLGTTGFSHDITERKQTEDALNQFKYTLDQTLDSVFMFRQSDYRLIYVNKGAMEQVGYTYDELMGMTPLDIKPEFTLERFREMVQPLRDGTKSSLNFETIHRHKSGHDIPVEIFLQLVRKEGVEPRFMAIVRDISMRRNNEVKIERLSRTYRLLSMVNEAIVRAKDRSELFAAICNAAIESGLFRFVWIGMLDETWVIPVAHAGVEDGYLSGKFSILLNDECTGNGPTGRAVRENTYVVCQDIEHDPGMAPWRDEAIRRDYRSSAAFPICEQGGEVGAINVYAAETHFFTPDIIELMRELAADVSFALDTFAERKRRELAEDEIRRINAELEHRVAERTSQLEVANKELEAFSYSVSHDLRAPLRSIDGFSRTLSKKYHSQLDATGQDWLDRIRRASQHMGHLIDDMLKLSQVTRSPLKREPIDLSKIAENVADSLSRTNPERKVRFILQQGLSVQADHGLLHIVMDNLLSNAFKFTGKKADTEIEFGVRTIDGKKAFFVRDNGDGFNMEYAHKLFGTFQRLHTANEFEGTGVGLATVQRVIHRHNGKVWAEAIEGQGATFYFTLPQRDRADSSGDKS